ncbi:MAG TPA: hypothetical protein VEZ90_19770, partial [Blastocatellia bacterium]|nr:hypothetical protein [Blastocatellia bacterium]
SREYTAFARKAAEEEIERRKNLHPMCQPADQQAEQKRNSTPGSSPIQCCYVEVWQYKNFAGGNAVLKGPVELQTLKTAVEDWGDTISSLRVGPCAFVLAFQHCNFSGRMMTFGPNEEVADLGEYHFDKEIESVRLIDSLKIFDQLDISNAGSQIDNHSFKADCDEDFRDASGDTWRGRKKAHKKKARRETGF